MASTRLGADGRVVLQVFRGDASGGAEKAYQVPLVTGMVVLDAIHYIQAHSTGTWPAAGTARRPAAAPAAPRSTAGRA